MPHRMPQQQQQQQQQQQPYMPQQQPRMQQRMQRMQQQQQPQQMQRQQFERIPPIPPPLPDVGCHVLLVTGRSGQECGVLDPCVDEIASCLWHQFTRRQQQQEDGGYDDDSTDSEYDSDSAYEEEWNRGGGGALFPNRRSVSFDRAGRSPSPPPRPKKPKLTRRDDGPGAGYEEGTASKDGGDDHDDMSVCESDCDSNDDDAIVRRLAERCYHPLSRSFAAIAPCMVHVVETLSELDDVDVAMDHVVLIHRDLDTVAVSAAPLYSGGGSARVALRQDDATNSTATAGPNASSQGLSAEDRRALRRNMMMSGDWERRISRVRIVSQPFAMLPPLPQHQRHDTGCGRLPPEQQHLQDNGDFEIPTFVCHEYDPNSIRQVATILRTIAGGHARPRRPPLKPPNTMTVPSRAAVGPSSDDT
jgi:hypothetical protein